MILMFKESSFKVVGCANLQDTGQAGKDVYKIKIHVRVSARSLHSASASVGMMDFCS